MTPTREEVIRVARECGMHRQVHNLMSNPMQQRFGYDCWEDQLVRLAQHFYEAGAAAARGPLTGGDERRHVICLCPDCVKPLTTSRVVDQNPPSVNYKLLAWLYEDTLPSEYPYDAMFPHSAVVDGVRMFPVFSAPLTN